MGKLRDVINALMGPTQDEAVSNKIVAGEVPLSAVRAGKFEQWGVGNAAANSYNNNYVIYRGITLLAQSIAALPLNIYRGKELMDPEFTLPGLDLQNPNSEMSLYELLYQSCIYYFYRGEFMAYINIEGGSYSLEPVNPKLMRRTPNGMWKWDNKIIIPDEQLIYCKLLNPDGERGLSPVDVVSAELNIDLKAVEYNTAMLENFGQMGGVLTDPNGMYNKEIMEEAAKEVKANHKGSSKAGELLVLGGGLAYTETAKTMVEMQFLEGRKDVRDRLLSILGIHKAVFGVTDQVDRAVAESARRMLWQDTLQPNAIRIAEKFNITLMKEYYPEYRVAFNFDGVEALKADMKERLERAINYRKLSYSVNEINDLLDLGMEDLNEEALNMRVVESTYVPVDDFLMPPEPAPAFGKPGGDEEPELEPDKKADKVIDSINKIVSNDNLNKASRKYKRQVMRLRRKTEKAFNGKLRRFFSEELGMALSILYGEKAVDVNENELLAALQNMVQKHKEVLTTRLTPVYEDGSLGTSSLALGMIDATTIQPRIHTAIVERAAFDIKGISNYTYKLLRNDIKKGLEAGETIDQLAKRIKNVYQFGASRSRIIARTETGKIINQSADQEYKDAGVKKKQWIGGTRDSHVANAGEGIVDYGHSYIGGLQFPLDAGPPGEVINCTCALAPVIED